MDDLLLFTDGSVNTKSKTGYGAYLIISRTNLSQDELSSLVKLKRFDQTSSSKLELQTLLWALKEIQPSAHKVIIYTDSQNIISLPERRKKLEKNNFSSKNNNKINNYLLYQEFYSLLDMIDCEFIKVKGHIKSSQKDSIDQIFTLVDKAARKALRKV